MARGRFWKVAARRVFWDTASDWDDQDGPSLLWCMGIGIGLGGLFGVLLFGIAGISDGSGWSGVSHTDLRELLVSPFTLAAAAFGGFSGFASGLTYGIIGGRIGALACGLMAGVSNPFLWLSFPGNVRHPLDPEVICWCWLPFVAATIIAFLLDAWIRRRCQGST